ncbi:MAG: hypothetical protein ACLGG0_14000 [Bacteriovoracia bacterium]
MSQIFNKSTHPVTVKRIAVRVWALRDEIEAAIDRRIKECEAAGTALYIDDIKEYYGMRTDQPLSEQPQLQLVDGEAAPTENMDQMMEALASETPAAPEEAPPVEAAPIEAAPADGASVEGVSPDAPVETAQKADEIIATQSPEAAAEAPKAPHLQRPYTRTAPNSDKISYGFALLADVNMEWMLTFSKQGFIPGQSVVVEFLIPRPFMLSAEIMMCNNVSMRSRIISESKPDFRLQCRLTYALAGERARLRDFLTSVEPDLPKKMTAVKPQEEAGPEL